MDYRTKFNSLIKTDYSPNNSSLNSFNDDVLRDSLEQMIYCRLVEQKLAKERKAGEIGGPVHLGAGQEAVAVGISTNLNHKDKVFGAHRSHTHLLSMNMDPQKLFAEVLGKDSGFSKGMGGSMHLWDQPSGFYGSVPIVAGTVPLAVGAAISSKMNKDNTISVAYLGDGAAEEGVVAESMNLASTMDLPVLFVVENNFYSSHMHISQRQPDSLVIRFAEANSIESELIDGNNILEVMRSSSEIISRIRNEGKPGFIEAITYRYYGHVDWREDIDVGISRSKDELMLWKSRDPIIHLKNLLIDSDLWSEEEHNLLQNKITEELNVSWEKAVEDPYPDDAELINRVYAK